MDITPEIKQLARRLAEHLHEIKAAQLDCAADEFSPEEAAEVFEFDLQKWILSEQTAGNITLAPKPPLPEDNDATLSFVDVLLPQMRR